MRGARADLDLDDGGDPDPAALRAARRGGRGRRARRRRHHQFERRQRVGVGLDLRHRHQPRLRRRDALDRLQLLGQRRRGHRRRACSAIMRWHSARHLADLEIAADIGRRAGERAAARLDPVRVPPGPMTILFDPRVATTPARPFRRRDQRRGDRAQVELPARRARHAGLRARRHDPRRSAAPARPAQPRLRRRGAAGRARSTSSPTAC